MQSLFLSEPTFNLRPVIVCSRVISLCRAFIPHLLFVLTEQFSMCQSRSSYVV